jgi:hypothetical protein
LLTNQSFEICQWQLGHSGLTAADPPHHFESTLIHRIPGYTNIKDRADHGLAQSTIGNPRLQVSNTALQKLIVQPALRRLSHRTRGRGINPRHRLYRGRAIDREEKLLAPGVPRVSPSVKHGHNLARYGFLHTNEWIVICVWIAMILHPSAQMADARHERIGV